ncbi:hypothetical protein FQA39_LY11239 [Lamprigera yunnana]|nr:hypothetical protein FQA39_LY11239 [Lamprigera yunnana]
MLCLIILSLFEMFNTRQHSNDDRFIPRRHGVNIDLLNYMMIGDQATASLQSDSDSHDQGNKRFTNKAYLRWQRKMLQERIKSHMQIPSRMLNFSLSKTPKTISNVVPNVWPVRARNKPVIGSPAIILDMPSIAENSNSIDWSKSDHLACVFYGEVFIWHPKQNFPKKITSTNCEVSNCLRWSKTLPVFAMVVSGTLRIYNYLQNKVVEENACVCGSYCNVTAMEWSSKSDLLITGCSYGHLSVFNSKLKLIRDRQAHDGTITQILLSCFECYIATTAEDKNVRLWFWPELRENFQVTYHTLVRGIAWHPWKDPILAVGGGLGEGSLCIWNATNHKQLGYRSHTVNKALSVDSITWNPLTGELVVSYWLDIAKSIIVVLSNLTTEVDEIEWHTGRVICLLWGDEGSMLATVGADENLCMWEFLDNSTKNAIKKKKIQTKKRFCPIVDTAKIFKQVIR